MKDLETVLTYLNTVSDNSKFSRKEALDTLYQSIEDWLSPILDKKLVTISRTPTQLDIPGVGVESVDILNLDFSVESHTQRVVVSPRTGTSKLWVTLSSAKGKVGLIYDRSRTTWLFWGAIAVPLNPQGLSAWLRAVLIPEY